MLLERKWWLVLGLAAVGLAGTALAPAGAADFSSLDIDFLGRDGAIQGLVARPGAAANMFWNPPGLAALVSGRGTGFAGYMDYLAGTRGAAAGYAWSVRPGRGYGVYVAYLSSGSLPLTTWSDPVGDEQSFSYSEAAGGAAWGLRIHRRLLVGGGLKMARENLDNVTSSGAFFDVGAVARLAGRAEGATPSGVYLGVVGRNIALAKWGADETEAPTGTEIGLAAESAWGPRGGVSVLMGKDGEREVRLGVAASLSSEFEIRLGWRRRVGTGSDEAYGFAWQRGLVAGFGVSLGRFWVDYTYEDASPLDAIHRFALRADIRPQ